MNSADHHFSPGQDVWVIAGHHANIRSAEHAAKVVRGTLPSSNDEIMIEWHSTGTAEVVKTDRARPMYDDCKEDGGATFLGTSCADVAPQPPKRKSRRVSNKPDRFDSAFASSQYQSMSVGELRKKCKHMDIDTKGCAKGDMIALIVKKEEKSRWRRDGKSEMQSSKMEMIHESDNADGKNRPIHDKTKKTKLLGNASKRSVHPPKPTKNSPRPTKRTTPRKVHLSHRLAAIFSPTNGNKRTKPNPRRISEFRRRRNDMEDRVRTQLLTARKKSRREVVEDENTGDNNEIRSDVAGEGCGKRLFEEALAQTDSSRNGSGGDDISIDTTGEGDVAPMLDSPVTVCYPEPSSPSPSLFISKSEIGHAEDTAEMPVQNPDRIQILYSRLHLAKADYIHNLQALQKMKSDGGYEEEDFVELLKWKVESRANVDQCRAMLNKALEEESGCPAPCGQEKGSVPDKFCV